MTTTGNIYSDRVVLFIDILGFKEMVRARKEVELLQVLEIPADLEQQFASTSMRVTAFSDSIVISDTFDEAGAVCERFLRYANYLQWRFLGRGALVRGGVVMGQFYHENGICLGPALIEAYELESQIAVYPRIVVSAQVRETTFRGIDSRCAKEPLLGAHAKSVVREDFDGIWYLDLFSSVSIYPDEVLFDKGCRPSGVVNFDKEQIVSRIGFCIESILERRPPISLKVSMKYDWLKHRYLSWRSHIGACASQNGSHGNG